MLSDEAQAWLAGVDAGAHWDGNPSGHDAFVRYCQESQTPELAASRHLLGPAIFRYYLQLGYQYARQASQ
jgi:hypothetical protein